VERDRKRGISFGRTTARSSTGFPVQELCSFQGPEAQREKLASDLESPSTEPTSTASSPAARTEVAPAGKKVFVVHGHDSTAREQLELVLHRLKLDPFVLANTGGGGLTIIEALEKEIGLQPGGARFGIVLMTPDDMGYAKAAAMRRPSQGPDRMLCLRWEC
jgi:predicted nucleotide-binding protein